MLADVLWATIAGIAIGVAAGWALAHISARMRGDGKEPGLLDDFLGLGLIALVYGLSLWLHAWGFLAVFFAAVALRQTELKLFDAARKIRQQQHSDSPQEHQTDASSHRVSEASLIFKEHLERLSVLVLVLMIGGMAFVDSWSWRAVGLAFFLFAVARPLSVIIGLVGTGTPWRLQGLAGWFGVRGIGSLYYLMYAIQHGLPEELALVVVTLSILLHGISVKPMMNRFWPQKKHRSQP